MMTAVIWFVLGFALAVIAERARFRAWDSHQRTERRLIASRQCNQR
jgi:hypothetical protein